ncbi:MAG: dTDP-4-dehydrorhamnose 3,5-epimerase [Bacteroidales bacterium]|nr:dTDP-4-dehydrorhamnose 3,5-epimerase [Bacteroidales bacterium]MDD4218486.1 dTDP-4-dehydrorhamnose 3,5-epimerase [Bacteroidales bacterium]MDY0142540.1 dTDP-4-dehydrorhamnose 3,5-epimerase [Bacteroidales bacterium]
MIITKTKIEGLLIIKPKVFNDKRGYFFESWNQKLALENGIVFNPLQHNESSSGYGVIRGLHYQIAPYGQTKLVRVISGKVLDVAVDLRKNSPTFGQHVAVELSGENKTQFLIPKGFAHGFAVLSERAIFSYMCDEYYNPQSERGIQFDDPKLKIDWKISPKDYIISEKDTKNPAFIDAEMNF